MTDMSVPGHSLEPKPRHSVTTTFWQRESERLTLTPETQQICQNALGKSAECPKGTCPRGRPNAARAGRWRTPLEIPRAHSAAGMLRTQDFTYDSGIITRPFLAKWYYY